MDPKTARPNGLLTATILIAVAMMGIVADRVLFQGEDMGSTPRSLPNTRRLPAETQRPTLAGLLHSPIRPIPDRVDVDPDKVLLGARLFADTDLSLDRSISCASCHHIDSGGDDERSLPEGFTSESDAHNTPTVLNSGFSFRQFWDGRADSLEAQVEGPVLHANEMNMSWPAIVDRLEQDSVYMAAFQAIYGTGPTRSAIKNSIAEFERSLITPGGAFDRYLKGDSAAISAEAKEGYERFLDLGCASCHQGVNVGGNMFQHLGQQIDYFGPEREPSVADNGRFNVTGIERDRHRFKVPTLRNIAETAPYFHDGSIETLDQAVRIMAKFQLGNELDDEEVASLVAFLHTLSGPLASATHSGQ